MKNIQGNIADLFCGVGTFSYLLASMDKVKITAVDSSEQLLKGFLDSVNRNQITNIKIMNKNLFKYPLDETELKDFAAVLFDPPRAGAKAVCEKLAQAVQKPEVVVAVSCNPNTFVNDVCSIKVSTSNHYIAVFTNLICRFFCIFHIFNFHSR